MFQLCLEKKKQSKEILMQNTRESNLKKSSGTPRRHKETKTGPKVPYEAKNSTKPLTRTKTSAKVPARTKTGAKGKINVVA